MPRTAEIKNLKKAAERIKKAIKEKERIILYGDADLDGVSSVVILKEAIQNLGGEIPVVFFPDRENDGYGITERALESLKKFAPALFISVDLGIGNMKEAKIAKSLGFDLIIIDHHQILEGKVPQAQIIVDPNQKGDKYPFKQMANVGLVFKLSEKLLSKNFSESLKNSFLELTALATLADMMPVEEDNKRFVDLGLDALRSTFRPGLRAFFEIFNATKSDFNSTQKIISSLNTCERIGDLNETYLLLTTPSLKDAKKIAENLIGKTEQKQFRVREIVRDVENRVGSEAKENIVFEGDPFWQLALAGSVASITCQRYDKPTFIFRKGEKESFGSVRVPKGIDSVKAMTPSSNILITYGGHPPASGFRIKNENLEEFKKRLIKYFEKR